MDRISAVVLVPLKSAGSVETVSISFNCPANASHENAVTELASSLHT